MSDTENCSEVARLLSQIDQELEAAQLGLNGLALGAARHDFINARLEHASACQEQLAHQIGEAEARRLLIEHYIKVLG
ncbi:hypothetical protein EPA93_38345 [Ktedonosporobacter rubrisoli]|uniref:Uncharacterized protein n=1 Tax=Ktedonosporobacter rubrisoli TaxID=2509675 RepID=A0A4P6K1H2_KTERU|nr:hypothetical protein [Ktedonosporobacter rubrisoli]QBD81520.1 hypothetical protein EPA93_38345 [Ktedonosporobacter rubrisoli]